MNRRSNSRKPGRPARAGLTPDEGRWLAAVSQALILHIQFLRQLRKRAVVERQSAAPAPRRLLDLSLAGVRSPCARHDRPCLVTIPRHLTNSFFSLLFSPRA